MPDILMTRIDNRLVHGQVGVAWTTALQGVNLIVVADDLAAADPLQQSLMAATAKSSGCGIRFFTLDKTIAVIHKASARPAHASWSYATRRVPASWSRAAFPLISCASAICMLPPARK